jgi:hypothetical protein
MDKHSIIPRKPFTIVLRCPACGTQLEPPTRHSCGKASDPGPGLLEDLSAIAEYLREDGDGRIVSASITIGLVA